MESWNASRSAKEQRALFLTGSDVAACVSRCYFPGAHAYKALSTAIELRVQGLQTRFSLWTDVIKRLEINQTRSRAKSSYAEDPRMTDFSEWEAVGACCFFLPVTGPDFRKKKKGEAPLFVPFEQRHTFVPPKPPVTVPSFSSCIAKGFEFH